MKYVFEVRERFPLCEECGFYRENWPECDPMCTLQDDYIERNRTPKQNNCPLQELDEEQ